MNKNILAFLIPLITLSIIAFTPIFDSLLGNLKFKTNLVAEKTIEKVKNKEKTKDSLTKTFKKDVSFFKSEIEKEVKDSVVVIHALNYLFYLNQRNLSFSKNKFENSTLEILKNYELMNREYQAIKDIYGPMKLNLIKLYKSRNRLNEQLTNLSYGIIKLKINDYDLKDYMGDDINYTASDTLVF